MAADRPTVSSAAARRATAFALVAVFLDVIGFGIIIPVVPKLIEEIGGIGLDVYEQEADLFFEDLSSEIIQDDVFQRLLTFPNVLITGHQAFFTEEALTAIADTTMGNLADEEAGRVSPNRVLRENVAGKP